MHDCPATAELRKTQQVLRVTEDELGRQRQHSADLGRRLAAAERKVIALQIELAMLDSIRKKTAKPPEDITVVVEPAFPKQASMDGDRFQDVHVKGDLL